MPGRKEHGRSSGVQRTKEAGLRPGLGVSQGLGHDVRPFSQSFIFHKLCEKPDLCPSNWASRPSELKKDET